MLTPAIHVDTALKAMAYHVANYERRFRSKQRIPKNQHWKPSRFAVRDVLIGMLVTKYDRRENLLLVDVCISEDLHVFDPFSGTKIVIAAILSDAFMSGSSMEIKFTQNVEDGRVPIHIQAYANHNGVRLSHASIGVITPAEARDLYLAATGFSDTALKKIKKLAIDKRLSSERVCFMVHNGIWPIDEAETILLGAEAPDRVLLGSSLPEIRHSYVEDLSVAKMAVLGGFLSRKVKSREISSGKNKIIDPEASDIRVETKFDEDFGALVYRTPKDKFLVPWIQNPDKKRKFITTKRRLVALLRPRPSNEILLAFDNDLASSVRAKSIYSEQSGETVVMLLYPREFEDIPKRSRNSRLKKAENNGVLLCVCPETDDSLNLEASNRLTSSRLLRR